MRETPEADDCMPVVIANTRVLPKETHEGRTEAVGRHRSGILQKKPPSNGLPYGGLVLGN